MSTINALELFQTAYQSAAPEKKFAVDNNLVSQCVETLVANHALDDSQHVPLIRTGVLLTLNAIDIDTAQRELMQLGVPNAAQVIGELWGCVNNSINAAAQQPQAVAPVIAPPQPQIAVAPVESIYSSTQSAILHEAERMIPAQPAPVQRPVNPAAVHQPTAVAPAAPNPAVMPIPTQTPPPTLAEKDHIARWGKAE